MITMSGESVNEIEHNQVKAVPVPQVKPTVYIVGFAASWEETPWSDISAELWGMNALHKMPGAAEKPWSRWYQLHDIEKHHSNDLAEHLNWLANSGVPVFMWEEEVEKWRPRVPNALPYPRNSITSHFGTYFNNTVSWMIAHAIWEDRKKIGVYGVDMAQDALVNAEYSHQRPSCEFFLGWAAGAGIEVDIPLTSDLLKTPFLYGVEEHHPWRFKLETRIKELTGRKEQLEAQLAQGRQQIGQLEAAINQVAGAIEDSNYYLRAWSIPNAVQLNKEN